MLGAIIVVLFLGGLQAFHAFGFGFLISDDWDPVQHIYGAAVPIFGTVVTSILALLLAVPLAFGIAFYLTEWPPSGCAARSAPPSSCWRRCPRSFTACGASSCSSRSWRSTSSPPLIDSLGRPSGAIGFLFSGPPFGTGILTAALILAVMVIPFIAATMRDVFETVPPVFKELAYGVGCTTWEVMRSIVIPYTRTSVVGGIMLGLGRALGETMAVTFVIGNTNRITSSLFGPGNTIASLVALEFPESQTGSLKLSSLLALGFILFVISFIVLAISRLLLRPRLKAMSATISASRSRAGQGPDGSRARWAAADTLTNRVVKVLCVVATVIGLALLASILFTLLWRGVGGLSLSVFTTSTLPPARTAGC